MLLRPESLRAAHQVRGTPVGPYGTLIAGHALRLGMTLVTANTREFQRVSGLKLESWRRP
jgi:tRNA(fMet)-specific endonuclease VapC